MHRPLTRSQSPLEPDILMQEFMEALSTSSPAFKQQLLDTLSPATASHTAPPDAIGRNHLIMAAVLSASPAQIAVMCPTLASTHIWYDGIKPFIGKLPQYASSSFLTWSYPEGHTDHTAGAKLLLDQFIMQCPWALPLTGTAVIDPT